MEISDLFTRIRFEAHEEKGSYRVTARAFTNEYLAYDDIGVSTRLEEKRRRPISKRTYWHNVDGRNSVRALYVINDAGGQSVVLGAEDRYQVDNYVSVRAPRMGIQVGGTIGDILNPSKYEFKIDMYCVDLEDILGFHWDKLGRAVSVKFPINIKFTKDKARQYDGVIGFHATKIGSCAFWLTTRYNVNDVIVVPEAFKDKVCFALRW